MAWSFYFFLVRNYIKKYSGLVVSCIMIMGGTIGLLLFAPFSAYLGWGESLAFFQFADAGDHKEFGPELPLSGFRHIAMKVDQATQDGIHERLTAAGYGEPDMYVLNHGYCYSLYVFDPAKLLIEFTVDCEDMDEINADQRTKAHKELERWLAGDHSPNNEAYHR